MVSTIQRVLRSRGFVTPNAKKQPKCSRIRFAAEFPNECWQADVTHVEVADGVVFEVLNMIDDHSRLCVASRAFVSTRSADVVRTLHAGAATWGYPRRFLSDNGRLFTTPMGVGVGALEAELLACGIETTHSRPYRVTLRYKNKLHHIGVGSAYAGWRVVLLIDGLDVRVIGIDGSPLRHLTLDPSVDYQRIP